MKVKDKESDKFLCEIVVQSMSNILLGRLNFRFV